LLEIYSDEIYSDSQSKTLATLLD